jgi:hypothetical protein
LNEPESDKEIEEMMESGEGAAAQIAGDSVVRNQYFVID